MLSRDFTATAFVIWQGKVLLHKHKKLGIWLPCGGHIETNELPDDAAIREVFEEAGVRIELLGDKALELEIPRQLVRPRGIQLELIHEGHEHIDLIYFAKPVEGYDGYLRADDPSLGWYTAEECRALELTKEVQAWLELIYREAQAQSLIKI